MGNREWGIGRAVAPRVPAAALRLLVFSARSKHPHVAGLKLPSDPRFPDVRREALSSARAKRAAPARPALLPDSRFPTPDSQH
jgi:hypothetical protein